MGEVNEKVELVGFAASSKLIKEVFEPRASGSVGSYTRLVFSAAFLCILFFRFFSRQNKFDKRVMFGA